MQKQEINQRIESWKKQLLDLTKRNILLDFKEEKGSKILVLEKGILPQGASTKNAGFACFGSLSEIIDDLKTHSEEETRNSEIVNKTKQNFNKTNS